MPAGGGTEGALDFPSAEGCTVDVLLLCEGWGAEEVFIPAPL